MVRHSLLEVDRPKLVARIGAKMRLASSRLLMALTNLRSDALPPSNRDANSDPCDERKLGAIASCVSKESGGDRFPIPSSLEDVSYKQVDFIDVSGGQYCSR